MDHPHLLVPRLWLKQLKYFFVVYTILFFLLFSHILKLSTIIIACRVLLLQYLVPLCRPALYLVLTSHTHIQLPTVLALSMMAGVNCTGEHQQPSHTKDPATLVLVGITCCLSVLGTLLIISSYLFFKALRTPARLILVHLSFMDLGIALAHLTGVIMADFNDKYYNRINNISGELNSNTSSFSMVDFACKTQATLTAFFALSSFFWTGFLAVYMYFRIVHISTNTVVQRMFYFSYLFCYGFPFGLSAWLLATGRLGYTWFSGGWCSLIVAEKDNPCTNSVFVTVFGYDIWVYTTFILASVLYISVHVHIRLEVSTVSTMQFTQKYLNWNVGIDSV